MKDKTDPAIARIRKVREKISEKFGYDVKKIGRYYMKLQEKHCDRFVVSTTKEKLTKKG